MTDEPLQKFGGSWTEEKLEALRKYLAAYTTILTKHPFRIAYIDAFAGTGYREVPDAGTETEALFPELTGEEARTYLDGSARIALRIEPPFTKYIFIEQDPGRCEELSTLRKEFPQRSEQIELVQANCNAWLQDRCQNRNWEHNRAALFLDPFGMQVEWETMEAIAATKAIDVLILFPLGVAVNRLLRRDGQIQEGWRARLDKLFGTGDWYDAFYREETREDLFGGESQSIKKTATLESISLYYVERLKSIFAKVADRPKPLCNSRNNPLFHLCFAAGNPKGAPTAVKIAKHILEG